MGRVAQPDTVQVAFDPLAEYEIYKKFDNLVGGRSAIYISHRLSSCRFCDRIAVFADKTVKEYGSHEELMSSNGLYKQMFDEYTRSIEWKVGA